MPRGKKPAKSTPNKSGRPSPYAGKELQLATIIAQRLSFGEPLAIILRSEEQPLKGVSWPSHDAVEDWINARPDVERVIARGRDNGEKFLLAQCLEIADNEEYDWIMTKKGQVTNETAIARAKLQIDTRLKLLAKWNPRKYGDNSKVVMEHGGVVEHRHVLTEAKRAELVTKKREAMEIRLNSLS